MTKKMKTPVTPSKMAYQMRATWWVKLKRWMLWRARTRKIESARKPSRLGMRVMDAVREGRGQQA